MAVARRSRGPFTSPLICSQRERTLSIAPGVARPSIGTLADRDIATRLQSSRAKNQKNLGLRPLSRIF